MKNYFLNCGSNIGQSTIYFIDKKIIDSNFEIHLFEPNEVALNISKDKLKSYSDYNIIYHQVAVWKENCKRKLTVEYCPGDCKCQLNPNNIIPGGYKTGGATNIMEGLWKKPNYILDENISSGGLVECIDFSDFLKKNIEPKSNVICKMDIEGAEYEVLNKLINDNTISIIKSLYIEWHNHLLIEKHSTSKYIKALGAKKINVTSWI